MLQTRTKDGFVLGLQRVSSTSVVLHESSPPVLLIHGLFMVIALVSLGLVAYSVVLLVNILLSLLISAYSLVVEHVYL